MIYKKVLAIDPGGTTGTALRLSNGLWLTSSLKTWEQLCDFILNGLDTVVIENFKAEHISTYGLHTVKLVGGVQFACRKMNIPLVIHQPQDRYPFRTDARQMISDAGIPYVVHEMDALAHLLRWENDNGII